MQQKSKYIQVELYQKHNDRLRPVMTFTTVQFELKSARFFFEDGTRIFDQSI